MHGLNDCSACPHCLLLAMQSNTSNFVNSSCPPVLRSSIGFIFIRKQLHAFQHALQQVLLQAAMETVVQHSGVSTGPACMVKLLHPRQTSVWCAGEHRSRSLDTPITSVMNLYQPTQAPASHVRQVDGVKTTAKCCSSAGDIASHMGRHQP